MANRPGPGPDDVDADLLAPDALGAPDEPAAPDLTDELDLHTFLPRDCADVVAEYLEAAQDAGMAIVRIVHGVLDGHPAVRSYRLAGDHGGWGATVVELHPSGG